MGMDAVDRSPALARSDQLPRPGTALPVFHDGDEWVLVRGFDGKVRMFQNRCPHRQMPLVEEACSTGATLRCPWHFWTFELDGRLRDAVTIGSRIPDPGRYDLPSRPVVEEHGVIYPA